MRSMLAAGSRRYLPLPASLVLLLSLAVTVLGRATVYATSDPTANALGWGYNYYGYIGNGSDTDVTSPPWSSPSGESYVTQISAESGVLALHADGSVTAWGRNDEGQLGDGATSYRELSPVHVILPPVVQVSAGGDAFGLALTGSGQVYSWGNNTYGSLGRATSGSYAPTPAKVSGLAGKIRSASTGGDHALALTTSGQVWAWGWNFAGQLGDATKFGTVYQTPFQVPGLSKVIAVAADGNDSYALTRNGSVYAWGFDYGGQGHGPAQVQGLPVIKSISAGFQHGLAIDGNGNVWAWGSNQYGQVGDGGAAGWRSPVELTGLGSGVATVSAAGYSSFAIKNNGTAWAWGANDFGQLGNGNTSQQDTPGQVLAVANVGGISSNGFATLEWSGLQSGTPPRGNGHMVVLGDSVAAGEAVNYGYYWTGTKWVRSGPATPAWNDTTATLGGNFQQCHQSNAAYSRYFATFQDYTVSNMACTGATALQNNGIENGGVLSSEMFDTNAQPFPESGLAERGGDTQDPTRTVPAQLGGWASPRCSGCDAADPFFDAADPSVVLLTLGANDVNFGFWVSYCYDPLAGDCANSTNTTTLDNELALEKADLATTLDQLNAWASGRSTHLTVLVTDYYNPFDTSNMSCIDYRVKGIQLLQLDEVNWLQAGLNILNQNIHDDVTNAASADPNLTVALVDLSRQFGGPDIMAGHKWCSSSPWAYGGSIDYPDYILHPNGPLNPAPFHPTSEGQFAIYQQALAVLNALPS